MIGALGYGRVFWAGLFLSVSLLFFYTDRIGRTSVNAMGLDLPWTTVYCSKFQIKHQSCKNVVYEVIDV